MGRRSRAYQLQKRNVSGTTGYIACVPTDGDFNGCLDDLLAHPLDMHLHKYILENLAPENIAQLLPLLADTEPTRFIIAALLREWLLLNPEMAGMVPDADALPDAGELCQHTPLLLLWQAEMAAPERLALAEAFRNNLEKAIPVPPEVLTGISALLPEQSAKGATNVLVEEFLRAVNIEDESLVPPGVFWEDVEKVLMRNNLAVSPEMRHESSLSPIALLREWPVAARFGKMSALGGSLISYGRGLSLAQARASLRMEIIERASALADFTFTGKNVIVSNTRGPITLEKASVADLEKAGRPFYAPCPAILLARYRLTPFYWISAKSAAGLEMLVPAQAVFLFSSLEEPAIFDAGGSSGLGAGQTMAQARLAALLEIVERDATAVTPVSLDELVLARSEDPLLQGLLDDYRSRGIFPVFQNITSETGVPAWRCLVFGPDGIPAQATAASLSSKSALLSALTETPWPYSWATPAPFGKKSRRPPSDLPVLTLEALPDYTMANHASNLLLLENALKRLGLAPLYCDIGRITLQYPVCRAFIPGMETHAEFDALRQPSKRLLTAAWKKFFPMD